MNYEKEYIKTTNEIEEHESPVTSRKIEEAIARLGVYNVRCKNNKVKKTINLFLTILNGLGKTPIGLAQQRNKLLNIIKKIQQIKEIKEPKNNNEIQQINNIIKQLHNLHIETDALQSYTNIIEIIINFPNPSDLDTICKKSKIGEAIEYFSDYKHIKHMSNFNQYKNQSINYIIPIYIITKIIYNGKFGSFKEDDDKKDFIFEKTTSSNRQKEGRRNQENIKGIGMKGTLSENDKEKKKKYGNSSLLIKLPTPNLDKAIFSNTGYLRKFLQNIVTSYNWPGKGALVLPGVITYTRKNEEGNSIENFINYMENIFKYLEKMEDPNELIQYLNKGNTSDFKQIFFKSFFNFAGIQNNRIIKSYFKLGNLFKSNHNEFYEFYENLREKFKKLYPTTKSNKTPRRNKSSMPNKNLRLKTNTMPQAPSSLKKKKYVPPPPPSTNGINLSGLGPEFLNRNAQVNRQTKRRSFNNNEQFKNSRYNRGGNKTKKRKRKKRNKKMHKKKKHTKRYIKKHNKKRYTKKNK